MVNRWTHGQINRIDGPKDNLIVGQMYLWFTDGPKDKLMVGQIYMWWSMDRTKDKLIVQMDHGENNGWTNVFMAD